MAVPEEMQATPGQVATAWAKSQGVLPIIGARTRAQLDDQLAAAALSLSAEQVLRLRAVSAVPLGYSHELLATQQPALAGNHAGQVAWPARPVA